MTSWSSACAPHHLHPTPWQGLTLAYSEVCRAKLKSMSVEEKARCLRLLQVRVREGGCQPRVRMRMMLCCIPRRGQRVLRAAPPPACACTSLVPSIFQWEPSTAD